MLTEFFTYQIFRDTLWNFLYGLIVRRYSLIDSVLFLSPLILYSIFVHKINNSHWFIIIFFFFVLKKVPNISNYSAFDCLNFFYQSRKQISYIFNHSVSRSIETGEGEKAAAPSDFCKGWSFTNWQCSEKKKIAKKYKLVQIPWKLQVTLLLPTLSNS